MAYVSANLVDSTLKRRHDTSRLTRKFFSEVSSTTASVTSMSPSISDKCSELSSDNDGLACRGKHPDQSLTREELHTDSSNEDSDFENQSGHEPDYSSAAETAEESSDVEVTRSNSANALSVHQLLRYRFTEATGGKVDLPTAGSITEPILPAVESICHNDKFRKMIKSIVGELVVDRIDLVQGKLMARGIKSSSQLSTVIDELFCKARSQHHLVAACVDLCLRLNKDPQLQPIIGADGSPWSFRQILLDNCWPLMMEMLDNSYKVLQQTRSKSKQAAVGNCKILGELICRGAASPRLLIEAVEAMLAKCEGCSSLVEPLAALLLPAGSKFGRQSDWVHYTRFQQAMQQVKRLSLSHAVPKNMQLLLRDLLAELPSSWPEKSRSVVPEVTQGTSMLSIARSALLTCPAVPELKGHDAGSIKKTLRDAIPRPAIANKVVERACGVLSRNSIPPAPGLSCKATLNVSTTLAGSIASDASTFQPKLFHRELSRIVRELCSSLDVAAAVGAIQGQAVPLHHQQREFVDILTRACEISSSPARLATFSMAAALADDEFPIFDRTASLLGVRTFFEEVYVDLCDEIRKLKAILRMEMIPTLKAAFPSNAIDAILPMEFRS